MSFPRRINVTTRLASLWPFLRRVPVAGIIGSVAAIRLGQWVAQGGSTSDLFAVSLGALAALAVAVLFSNWRVGLYLFFFWLVFEDLPRKFMGNNMLIYFGKDLLVLAAYAGFLGVALRRRVEVFRPPFMFPLLAFAFFGCLQIFNPNTPSLLYGLLGVKLYFFYIPLLFLGYAMLRSEADLRRFLVFTLVIASVVAVLGVIQGLVGATFLNPRELAPEIAALGTLTRGTPEGGSFGRPSSVFVSDGRFASYMLLMFLLALGAVGYALQRPGRSRLTLVLSLVLCSAGLVMSGSRGSLLYAGVSSVVLVRAFVLGTPRGSKLRGWMRRAVRWGFVTATATLLALVVLFPGALESRWLFYWQTLSPWGEYSELGHRLFQYPLENLNRAFFSPHLLLGYGTGTAGLGVQYIQLLFNKPTIGGSFENGWATLITEMGLVAPLLWLAWSTVLVVAVFREVRRLRGTPFHPVAMSIAWFAFLLLIPFTYMGMAQYQNYILNAFLWLLTGMLFKLKRLLPQPAGAGVRGGDVGAG